MAAAVLDLAFREIITGLARAAQVGALLLTCRYPVPGPDLFLAEVPVPALSAAELRRLFLRLPALSDLDPAGKLLVTRTIGGHPRLIQFTDALLRGGRSNLMHVQAKLQELAQAEGINLRPDEPVADALDQAMIVGSADILLTDLIALLTPSQAAILAQVAVCRAPMTLDDLSYALTPSPGLPSTGAEPNAGSPPALTGLPTDTARLADLTLIASGPDIAMHPWTADLVTRNTHADLTGQHERALAMRERRFQQGRGSYEDLVDIPRHLAALYRWDDIASLAGEVARILPGTLATVAYLAP